MGQIFKHFDGMIKERIHVSEARVPVYPIPAALRIRGWDKT